MRSRRQLAAKVLVYLLETAASIAASERVSPDARRNDDRVRDSPRNPAPRPTRTPPPSLTRPASRDQQPLPVPMTPKACIACAGTGRSSCSSCGGYGYHQVQATRTRHDGTIEYGTDRVPCTNCQGGQAPCISCGGKGY